MDNAATLKVFRFDPATDGEPHYDTFHVPVRERMSVLEALFEILEKQDNTLAFRFACRGAVCGSCAMYISGSYRLACETLLGNLNTREITVAPLPHLPIIKDLAVDMEPFYKKFEGLQPYLKPSSTPPQQEWTQSIKQRQAINEVTDCVFCAACYSACPLTWSSSGYPGPAALSKVYRFVADSRDGARGERLATVDGEDGVWRCHTIFNCVEACPKRINQTRAIEKLRRQILARRLRLW